MQCFKKRCAGLNFGFPSSISKGDGAAVTSYQLEEKNVLQIDYRNTATKAIDLVNNQFYMYLLLDLCSRLNLSFFRQLWRVNLGIGTAEHRLYIRYRFLGGHLDGDDEAIPNFIKSQTCTTMMLACSYKPFMTT